MDNFLIVEYNLMIYFPIFILNECLINFELSILNTISDIYTNDYLRHKVAKY